MLDWTEPADQYGGFAPFASASRTLKRLDIWGFLCHFKGRDSGSHGVISNLRNLLSTLPALALVALAVLSVVSTSAPAQGRRGGGGPVTVEVAPVTISDIERTIQAVGSLVSGESVVIRPEVAGRVTSIDFEEGQRVAQDSLLITLDDSVVRAELAEARARLVLSQANAKRAKELEARGSGTIRNLDEALANERIGAARVDYNKARLAKTRIRAPFTGVLGLRHVSVGEYVSPGQDIVNLEAIDLLKADFRVPEIYLAEVGVGQQVHIIVDALAGRTFRGVVYAINPLIDESGRSIVIRARVPNDSGDLRPGLFARIRLVVVTHTDAVLVPEEAIVPIRDKQFVYTVVDGKVVLTPVSVGIRREAYVEITDGLSPGDIVVTAGQIKIRDGTAVKTIQRTPTS